jgi:hypothetical protein
VLYNNDDDVDDVDDVRERPHLVVLVGERLVLFVAEGLIQWVSAHSGQDRDALLASISEQTAMMHDADAD